MKKQTEHSYENTEARTTVRWNDQNDMTATIESTRGDGLMITITAKQCQRKKATSGNLSAFAGEIFDDLCGIQPGIGFERRIEVTMQQSGCRDVVVEPDSQREAKCERRRNAPGRFDVLP